MPAAVFLMTVLTVIGGGTGSTEDGLKIYRVYVMLKENWRRRRKVLFSEDSERRKESGEAVRETGISRQGREKESMMRNDAVDTEYIFKIVKNAAKVAVIWVFSTMLAIVLNHMGVRIENLLLIYVVGVVICSVETSSMCWGIGSAVVFVFTFNFLFTAPKFTLQVDDPNYVISLLIFIIVAFIVASLTVKLQKQMDIANTRTEITTKLNAIGSGFLNLAGRSSIAEYSCESLKNLTGKEVDILIRGRDSEEFSDGIAEWCYRNSMICGHGEAQFGENPCLYVPIRSSNKTYGVITLDCSSGDLEADERVYMDTVISQITLVLERERLNEEKEVTKLQIEKERLKSTLLRSISHDLRTPLTGIAGSSNFLYDNYKIVDEETAKTMLNDICTDAEWLNSMVENLLNMTRIQEGRLEICKKKEVVDDLISGAVTLVSKRLGDHHLKTVTPQDIVLLPVDARLFTQVLVNLIDNAIRHSGSGTTITVSARVTGSFLVFKVSDTGIGIPEDKLDQIFDNFFTTAYENGDRQRGVGLGLTICKAIVEAHGGRISVANNEYGGATFQIDMPMEGTK